MPSFADIQEDYVAELLGIRPEIESWWLALAGVRSLDEIAPEPVRTRWPTLWSGHPRVLAVFRKYYLMVDARNAEAAEIGDEGLPVADDIGLWGKDDDLVPASYRRPVDVLIHEIDAIDEDAYQLVEGIVFVPVGLDMNNEAV
jgi:hypothetical protein